VVSPLGREVLPEEVLNLILDRALTEISKDGGEVVTSRDLSSDLAWETVSTYR
jgi:hypothetical protein